MDVGHIGLSPSNDVCWGKKRIQHNDNIVDHGDHIMIFKKKKKFPKEYTEAEMRAVDAHINVHFGRSDTVFHEIVSQDIHLDVCIIEPTPERNYYTLVTLGMGAHRMNVPKQMRCHKIERAELFMCLPPDWEIKNKDNRWFWPIRLLKSTARIPGNSDSWLGYGHTVASTDPPEPYAENTLLCAAMLVMPEQFGEDSFVCRLPAGNQVVFYQLLPIYREEMEYTFANSAGELEALLGDDFDFVLNPTRRNVVIDSV